MSRHLASNPEVAKQAEKALLDETVTSPEFSEDALALEFVTRHQDGLRFCPETGKYYAWNQVSPTGGFWERSTVLGTFDGIRQLCRETAMLTTAAPKQNKLCSASTVRAIEQLSSSDQRISVKLGQFDSDQMALNTPAGTVDLETGKL